MAITLKFLGGVRTVTGSSHLLTTRYSRILLDCGLFYGHRDEFYKVNSSFSYNPRQLQAVLLSHAHIDHCGNIPSIIKRGLNCKIYTTLATKDLCALMLADSGKVQEEDIRYLRKIKRQDRFFRLRPLYTEKEGRRALQKFRPLSYRQRFKITRDVTCTFYDAGHVLGSSVVVLDVVKSDNKSLRIGYAVDLGREGLPLLNGPTVVEGLDYLVLESTYGNRIHGALDDAKNKLKDTINRTVQRKGKILIPCFALERTQEVIFYLNELIRDKQIPSLPVYIDSPLATNITDVFRNHYGYFNEETRDMMRRKTQGIFDHVNFHYVQDIHDSKALNMSNEPMIILAGSGMCEAGRIVHHLKNNISDSRNTILVVGYMAKDTLGKKIVDRQKIVRIYGVDCELNAEVVLINAFSRHADKNELNEYVQSCLPLKNVFIVHGDEEQSQGIYDLLRSEGVNVCLPMKDEEVVLV